MARSVPIPIPIRGLNTLIPLSQDLQYARELTNYSIADGKLEMRPPVTLENFTYTNSSRIVWHSYQLSSLWVIYDNGDIRKISDGSGASNVGGAVTTVNTVKHSSLDLIIGAREPRDAEYPFTAWTFTTIGITSSQISCACSHKGRLYVAGGGTVIEYSSVGQVTGAMYDSFDVAEYMDGQFILRMFSVNNINENLLIIFGDKGKVLIYAGDYPASSTWNLRYNLNISTPAGINAFTELPDGDLWVMTKEYVCLARELLTGNLSFLLESPKTDPIGNLWNTSSSLGYVLNQSYCFYDKALDAVFCHMYTNTRILTEIANYDNTSFFLVYFRKYKAWGLWFTADFYYPVRLFTSGGDSAIYRGVGKNGRIKKISINVNGKGEDDDYLGNKYPIETSWKTPYLNAERGQVQKVVGVRPIFLNEQQGKIEKIRLLFDYSDFNAPYGFYTQTTAVAQIAPENFTENSVTTQQSGVVKNCYSPLSGLGAGVSLQITQKGTDALVGDPKQEVFGATLYVTDGGDMI